MIVNADSFNETYDDGYADGFKAGVELGCDDCCGRDKNFCRRYVVMPEFYSSSPSKF